MRRSLLLALIIAPLAPSLVSAQVTQAGQVARVPVVKMTQDEATIATLTRLEELWSEAMVRRDRATFERTLAQKFVYTGNDLLVRRPDYLRGMLDGSESILEARTDSVEVHVFGNTGVVTGWRSIVGRTRDGATFERRHRFTDTWMPRSGTWQMIGAHDNVVLVKR